jgi:hypothetical protein
MTRTTKERIGDVVGVVSIAWLGTLAWLMACL